MNDWQDLKFDKMVQDISLANDYFSNKKHIFTSICRGDPVLYTETSEYTLDPCNNKIYMDGLQKYVSEEYNQDAKVLAEKFCQLAKKIKENTELICQLEYALRNKPREDVTKDIELLVSKCLEISTLISKYSCARISKFYLEPRVVFGTSLYYLSRMLLYLAMGLPPIIYAPPQAAAVCTLFTELCQKVGIQSISMNFMSADKLAELTDRNAPYEGCVGVVSETADFDSAVHAFISSTTLYPWRLNKILVQESVYEEFQKALQWKCNVNVSEHKSHEPNLKQLSADTQVAGDKIFLIDYVGTGDIKSELRPVVITAYRTNKELIKMMDGCEEPFVSLWCSDSANANEIALSITTSVVWINNYAAFNGSPRILSAVPFIKSNNRSDEVEKNANVWLKLDLKKRIEVTLEAIDAYAKNDEAITVENLRTVLSDQTPGFVEVDKNDLWMGIMKPVTLICHDIPKNSECFVDAIASVVHGNRLVMNVNDDNELLIKELQKVGLPIHIKDGHTNFYKVYETRAIYSSFGTIFAN